MAALSNAAAHLVPAMKERDRAMELLNQAAADIDGTLLNVAVGSPPANSPPAKMHPPLRSALGARLRACSPR